MTKEALAAITSLETSQSIEYPKSSTMDEGSESRPPQQGRPSPPLITAETLQYRLETGNIGKLGGQRSSLTRCAQKYGAFQVRLLAEHPDAEAIETSKQDLVRELELFELEMRKLILWQQQLERQVKRNQEQQQKRELEITMLSKQVKESSNQSKMAREIQGCFAEYEILAKLINDNHPTPIDDLQQQIDGMRSDVNEVGEETNTKDKILKVREAQYQLLIQYMIDMKRSVEEETNDDQLEKPAPMEIQDSLYGDL